LLIYWDADWATDQEDRHSHLGVVYFLGKNLVSWSSRKQSTPSVSAVKQNLSHCSKLVEMLFGSGASCVSLEFVQEVYPHK
jgi:hypothetical protein